MTLSSIGIFVAGFSAGMVVTTLLFLALYTASQQRTPQPPTRRFYGVKGDTCPHGLAWDDCPACRH